MNFNRLIVSWCMVWGTLFCSVTASAMAIKCSTLRDTNPYANRKIFNYSVVAGDMFIFFIGSLYFVAGSYNTGGNGLLKSHPERGSGNGSRNGNAMQSKDITSSSVNNLTTIKSPLMSVPEHI